MCTSCDSKGISPNSLALTPASNGTVSGYKFSVTVFEEVVVGDPGLEDGEEGEEGFEPVW